VGDVGEKKKQAMWVRKRSSCSSPSIGFYIYGEIAFLPLTFAGLVPIFFSFLFL